MHSRRTSSARLGVDNASELRNRLQTLKVLQRPMLVRGTQPQRTDTRSAAALEKAK